MDSHGEVCAHDVILAQTFIMNGTSYICQAGDTFTASKDGPRERDGFVVLLLSTEHVLDKRIGHFVRCIKVVLH